MNSAKNPTSLAEQLRAVAGVGSDVREFRIVWSSAELRAVHEGGSSNVLILSAPCRSVSVPASSAYRGLPGPALAAARPLSIQMRLEDGQDRIDKASGVNREVQLGDTSFDATVYIETDASDDAVCAVLGDVSARKAVIVLLESGATSCTIDDARGDISCSWVWNHSAMPDSELGARVLDAMVSLQQALPYLVTSGTAKQRRDVLGFVAAGGVAASLVLGIPATLAVYYDLAPPECMESAGDGVQMRCSAGAECCRPIEVGAPAGILVAAALCFVLQKKVRGHFDSASTQRVAMFFALVFCCELGIIVVRLVG